MKCDVCGNSEMKGGYLVDGHNFCKLEEVDEYLRGHDPDEGKVIEQGGRKWRIVKPVNGIRHYERANQDETVTA